MPRHAEWILAAGILLTLALPRVTSSQGDPGASSTTFSAEELDLGFENEPPERWNPTTQNCRVALDESEKHTGQRGLRMACGGQPGARALVSGEFPVEVARGKHLRFTGYLKSKGVAKGGGGALTLRVDGPHGVIGNDNMQFRRVAGTTDWTRHELSFDVPGDAVRIVFGAGLGSRGNLWVDTLGFELGEATPTTTAAGAADPAPDEVVGWIRDTALPLATTRPGSGFDDLRPLRGLIGDARVVGLGEATHGSREFFQIKHRLFEFLVEEMDFTVFAIEANWPESSYANDYVLGGYGDAATSLRNLAFPLWVTEEVLELVEWMRLYNADPTHRRKVRFYGIDAQVNPFALAPKVEAYLERVDPESAVRFQILMATWQSAAVMSGETRQKLLKDLERLTDRFDTEKERFIADAGEQGWVLVRQLVVILAQWIRLFDASSEGSEASKDARDEAMAANVQWILRTYGPGTRVAVWAHNGHVGKVPGSVRKPMGQHLAESLGDDYVALGLFFHQGTFQAFNSTRGWEDPGWLGRFAAPPAPAGYIEAAFARAGMPIFALDLSRRPAAGPVASWLGTPHPTRQIGTAYYGRDSEREKSERLRQNLVELYDGVVFVGETNRARPLRR